MFTAETKYSGNFELLVDEIEKKLVRDKGESKKKGVEQLADAVAQLFGVEPRTIVKDLDLSGVTRVYPLLVTLDGIGGSLLISRLLITTSQISSAAAGPVESKSSHFFALTWRV